MKTKQPALFIGHGSPMNALGGNKYSKNLNQLGQKLDRPKAILVFSAHWETQGTQVLAVAKPKTIHDFHGFPEALYQIQYPSPGAPALAESLNQQNPEIQLSQDWGLDHGTWSVLTHLYPKADVPVFQLSLDRGKTLAAHAEFAKSLRPLREQGILMLGSGNIVHNLRQIRWESDAPAFDWAVEADEVIGNIMSLGDVRDLVALPQTQSSLFRQAHPSLDHFIPLIYAMALKTESDSVTTIFDEIQNASIAMRSVQIG